MPCVPCDPVKPRGSCVPQHRSGRAVKADRTLEAQFVKQLGSPPISQLVGGGGWMCCAWVASNHSGHVSWIKPNRQKQILASGRLLVKSPGPHHAPFNMTGSRRSNEAFTICAKHSGVGKPSISSAQTAYVEASSSFKGAGKVGLGEATLKEGMDRCAKWQGFPRIGMCKWPTFSFQQLLLVNVKSSCSPVIGRQESPTICPDDMPFSSRDGDLIDIFRVSSRHENRRVFRPVSRPAKDQLPRRIVAPVQFHRY